MFLKRDISPYQKGEDVLIDILLLAKCDYILKGAAAVGEYAMWFNPSLKCTDFALASHYDFTSSASAFLKLNVGGIDGSQWRRKLLLRGLIRKLRYLVRPLLEACMWLGKRTLPGSIKDQLWKKIFRHLY